MKKVLFKSITVLLLFAFVAGDVRADLAVDNLGAPIVNADDPLVPDTAKVVREEMAEGVKPGAIGNGAPLVGLLSGELPEKIELDEKSRSAMIADIRDAIDLAIELHIKNREKIPLKHKKRSDQTLANLIDIQNDLTKRLYLYHGEVETSEDYLLAFTFLKEFGVDIELFGRLRSISTKRAAQYIYHLCVPEHLRIIGDGTQVDRKDHRVVYNEIQTAVFDKDEVIALKNDLREYINLLLKRKAIFGEPSGYFEKYVRFITEGIGGEEKETVEEALTLLSDEDENKKLSGLCILIPMLECDDILKKMFYKELERAQRKEIQPAKKIEFLCNLTTIAIKMGDKEKATKIFREIKDTAFRMIALDLAKLGGLFRDAEQEAQKIMDEAVKKNVLDEIGMIEGQSKWDIGTDEVDEKIAGKQRPPAEERSGPFLETWLYEGGLTEEEVRSAVESTKISLFVEIAVYEIEAGFLDDAVETAQKVYPDSIQAQIQILWEAARCLSLEGDKETAKRIFERTREIYSKAIQLWKSKEFCNIAVKQAGAGLFDEAKETCNNIADDAIRREAEKEVSKKREMVLAKQRGSRSSSASEDLEKTRQDVARKLLDGNKEDIEKKVLQSERNFLSEITTAQEKAELTAVVDESKTPVTLKSDLIIKGLEKIKPVIQANRAKLMALPLNELPFIIRNLLNKGYVPIKPSEEKNVDNTAGTDRKTITYDQGNVGKVCESLARVKKLTKMDAIFVKLFYRDKNNNERRYEKRRYTYLDDRVSLARLGRFIIIDSSGSIVFTPEELSSLEDSGAEILFSVDLFNSSENTAQMGIWTDTMLVALDNLDLKGKHVVDLASGSGILSVAALKHGAASADLVENDRKTREHAVEQFKLNGIEREKFRIFNGEAADIKNAEAIAKQILQDLGGKQELVIFSNLGYWEIYKVNNSHSIDIVRQILKIRPDIKITFVGGGYSGYRWKKRDLEDPINGDLEALKEIGFTDFEYSDTKTFDDIKALVAIRENPSPVAEKDTEEEREIRYQAELFKHNLMRVLKEHPDEIHVVGIDSDIGENQKNQLIYIDAVLRQLEDAKDDKGERLFPNLKVVRRSGSEKRLQNEIQRLIDQEKVKMEHVFMIVQCENLERDKFLEFEHKAWITAIEDGWPTIGDEDVYLPILESITLMAMAAGGADTENILRFYNTIADDPFYKKPVTLDDLLLMLKGKVIVLLPKSGRVKLDELGDKNKLVMTVYLSL
ncbi:MAG: 50S ribosomal protein L11 methyltransferase [Candidatus Omnitrophica bacterium]|nr:50S ribosomal protein L11 methyltransferase [Candidatus Omnitrophota bacterium]